MRFGKDNEKMLTLSDPFISLFGLIVQENMMILCVIHESLHIEILTILCKNLISSFDKMT